jgi:phosphatidylserine synthase
MNVFAQPLKFLLTSLYYACSIVRLARLLSAHDHASEGKFFNGYCDESSLGLSSVRCSFSSLAEEATPSRASLFR